MKHYTTDKEMRKNVMKKDKNQKYRGQEELLLFPMEKNKTKASEKQPCRKMIMKRSPESIMEVLPGPQNRRQKILGESEEVFMRRRKEEEDRLDCLVLIAFLIVAILAAIALQLLLF